MRRDVRVGKYRGCWRGVSLPSPEKNTLGDVCSNPLDRCCVLTVCLTYRSLHSLEATFINPKTCFLSGQLGQLPSFAMQSTYERVNTMPPSYY